jgi:hypothetical protein
MDEVDLMRQIAADVPLEDDEARSRARARLEAQIADETAPSSRRFDNISRPHGRLVAAATIAALVAVVLLVQTVLPPDTGGPSRAQATLNELAAVAAVGETPALAPGQFLYVKTAGVVTRTQSHLSLGGSWTFIVRVRRETWLASDGSGRIVEHVGRPRFATPEDRETWRRAGSPPLPRRPLYPSNFEPGELAPLDLGALPRDPDSLADLIDAGGATGTSAKERGDPIDTIANLLGNVPASADLRSALFKAAARLTGIVTLGAVRDPVGRSGIAVALVRSSVRTELIFDAESSALLARIVTQLDGEGHPFRVLARSTYKERGVVDSTHARP